MADNVVTDPGAGGATFATDDVGGNHYQRVKLTDGTADSSTAILSGGGVEASALRVTIANDSTGVLSVDDNGATLSIDDGAGSITVDGSVSLAAAIPAGTNNIGDVDVLTLPSIPAGNNNIGDVDIASAIPAGNNNIGDVDVASIAAGTNLIGDVGVKPRTSGGLTILHRKSTADTNLATIKASAGQLYGWYIYNDGTTERYVKLYNKASNPVLASDTPVMVLPIPAGSAANVFGDIGIPFGTGIALSVTGAAGDTDTTAVAANEVILNFFYA